MSVTLQESSVFRLQKDVRSVVCRSLEEAEVWDDFLGQCPEALIEQSTAWSRLKQVYGWKPTFTWVARGEQILGGAMILVKRICGLTIGYVERGPLWDENEPGAAGLVTETLFKIAQSLRLAYLTVVPPYGGHNLIPVLESHGFKPKPAVVPPAGVGRATLLLDLRPDLDSLMAAMSMTKRQNIRRGLKKGVRVRLGDGKDAQTLRDLMWLACKRRGVAPGPAEPDFFDNVWLLLGQQGYARFFVAEVNGEPVSAACVLVFGATAQLLRVGWSGRYEEINPNDALHWEMIKWAKENGCREFDFMHIRPDHAQALLAGRKINDTYSGVTYFKTAFGGKLRLLPEIYYRSFHPLVRSVLRAGGERVIGSAAAGKVLNQAARLMRSLKTQ